MTISVEIAKTVSCEFLNIYVHNYTDSIDETKWRDFNKINANMSQTFTYRNSKETGLELVRTMAQAIKGSFWAMLENNRMSVET